MTAVGAALCGLPLLKMTAKPRTPSMMVKPKRLKNKSSFIEKGAMLPFFGRGGERQNMLNNRKINQ